MKNIVKRMTALLCVIVILSSMMALPASASNDWEFRFTTKSTFSDWNTQNGTWRDVYFKFKGTGIQKLRLEPWTNASGRPVQAYFSYVNWRPAGQWCDGCIRVRALNNGDGAVYVYFNDGYWPCYSILIGY